jgi:hypothetical protein
MDEYRGKTIKCVSCRCSYSFDTGKILICDVCHENYAIDIQPYTVTIKKDAYSETLKETLEAGTRVTVHIAVCQKCLDREEGKMVYEKIIRLKDRIMLTTNGGYPTSVFAEQFSRDRYGVEAVKRANAYGESLWGTIVEIEGGRYRIKGHSLMMGACDYVGSLNFLVEEIF